MQYMACSTAERRTNSSHDTVVLRDQPTLSQPMLDLGALSARYPVNCLEGLAAVDSLDLGSLLNDSDLFGDLHRLAGRRSEQSQLLYRHMTESTNRKRKWKWERQRSQNTGKRIKTGDNGTGLCNWNSSDPNPPVFPQYSTPLQLTNCDAIVSGVDSFPIAAVTSTKPSESGAAAAENTRRRVLQMEVPMGTMLNVKELDSHILKLQAVRATLLDGAFVAGLAEGKPAGTAQGTSSRVPVSIVPIGVQALDEPLFDETSSLVNRVGCLSYEFNEAISNFKRMCCINDAGSNVKEDIGRCLAFISDHTFVNQRIVAKNSYRRVSTCQFNPSTTAPQVKLAIEAANEALKVAQCIALFSTYITKRLDVMVESATRKVRDCDHVCQEQMIVERQQVKAILRGNHAAVLHATKTWLKTTEDATMSIRMLIEGLSAG